MTAPISTGPLIRPPVKWHGGKYRLAKQTLSCLRRTARAWTRSAGQSRHCSTSRQLPSRCTTIWTSVSPACFGCSGTIPRSSAGGSLSGGTRALRHSLITERCSQTRLATDLDRGIARGVRSVSCATRRRNHEGTNRRVLRIDQAFTNRQAGQLHAIVDAKLVHHTLSMGLHSFYADVHDSPDLLLG
jgi:hypothetical protein